jgi:glycosyltransferase involved in cell wall biosynthesis
MRILIATTHRNVVGGVEKYLQAIIPALAIRGHEIALVFENTFNPALETIDPPELNLPAWTLRESSYQSILQSLAAWNPELVFSNGLEAADFQTALLNSYPTVLYAHNYLGTCATGQKCHAFPVPRPCTRQFGPACLVLHYPRRCGGLNPLTMWSMFHRSAEMNHHLPKYEAVLVASRHMRDEFRKHGVTEDRIHVVSLPNRQVAEQSRIRTAPNGRLLFIGRLTKLKGVTHLLRAIPIAGRKLGGSLTLTIAGEGPERESLQALAQELRVVANFIGWIQGSQMTGLMQDSDLLAVPSLWPEPFGLVGIEAGACGLPAVAYRVGGIPDWLSAGESGELAPGDPPSVEGLADAIVRALANPNHYARLSRGAYEVAGRFTLERHVFRLEEIFRAVPSRPVHAILPAESIHA